MTRWQVLQRNILHLPVAVVKVLSWRTSGALMAGQSRKRERQMAPNVAAVVVAAGRGSRTGGGLPKQYRSIGGEPMIRASLAMMSWHGEVSAVVPVIHPEDAAPFQAASAGLRLCPPVHGGATRQASVRAGLEWLSSNPPDIVLVHDAARPFCSAALVSRAIAVCSKTGAAIPAIDVADTIKTVDGRNHVTGTLERASLRSVQTPQAFAFPALLDAHRRAAKDGKMDFPDDAALAEWAGDLDILVNNAGAIPGGDLLKVDEETWRKAWDLKLFGYINLTRAVYAAMRKKKRGVIVNVLRPKEAGSPPSKICCVCGPFCTTGGSNGARARICWL